jgi:hypothetical protein
MKIIARMESAMSIIAIVPGTHCTGTASASV